jgi:hypothetical protein|tara:strand:- start:2536 stop:2685 length:150 start_codon:yes stop_codon:yes gene_type:complete
MKIKLKKNHSIRGVVEKADTTVEISEGVALDLIKRGIASKLDGKSKAGK